MGTMRTKPVLLIKGGVYQNQSAAAASENSQQMFESEANEAEMSAALESADINAAISGINKNSTSEANDK